MTGIDRQIGPRDASPLLGPENDHEGRVSALIATVSCADGLSSAVEMACAEGVALYQEGFSVLKKSAWWLTRALASVEILRFA